MGRWKGLMVFLLASAAISFAIAMFFVRQNTKGVTWGADSDFAGPQKFHCKAVPRLGGIGILAAMAICALLANWLTPVKEQMVLLVACAIPALAYGLAEDITLSISPRKRLMAVAVSAFLGAYVLGAVINRLDIQGVDRLLAWGIIAIPFTVFAVAGLANSINIIDGFNGLASMVCMMMFAAIAFVAYQVDDQFILLTSLCCIGALIGFFILNFPKGLIFLGDGGAYFMGFMLAELAVLLCHRNPQVSPWFALLLFLYPTAETGFSMYRRRFVKGVPVASPDGTHLHSLIFRRLLPSTGGIARFFHINTNSATSLYLWVLALFAVIPAALFWQNTPMLLFFCAVFIGVYLWLYQSIVRFRTPLWLRFR